MLRTRIANRYVFTQRNLEGLTSRKESVCPTLSSYLYTVLSLFILYTSSLFWASHKHSTRHRRCNYCPLLLLPLLYVVVVTRLLERSHPPQHWLEQRSNYLPLFSFLDRGCGCWCCCCFGFFCALVCVVCRMITALNSRSQSSFNDRYNAQPLFERGSKN